MLHCIRPVALNLLKCLVHVSRLYRPSLPSTTQNKTTVCNYVDRALPYVWHKQQVVQVAFNLSTSAFICFRMPTNAPLHHSFASKRLQSLHFSIHLLQNAYKCSTPSLICFRMLSISPLRHSFALKCVQTLHSMTLHS